MSEPGGPGLPDPDLPDADMPDPRSAGPADRTPHFGPEQLLGFRIGVTADRRSGDLIAALERRGAEVLHAPTLRIVPAKQDARVVEDTGAIIVGRPDITLATTAFGMRGWLEAADAAGIGAELIEVLGASRILVRGPKARGAIRAAGLEDDGMSAQETTESMVDQVLAEGVAGRTVAVQLHGFVDEEQLRRLRDAGATVVTVAPYRWTAPADPARVSRLIDAIAGGTLDAVTFTSAPAAEALLAAAGRRGSRDALVRAMQTDVLAACVGPVTAAPLHAAGIDSIHPDRYRLGALVRLLCEHLHEHRVLRLPTRHGTLEIRGRSVDLAGRRSSLSPTSVAVLRVLAQAGGSVVPRARLLAVLPEAEDEHALEAAIGRLRAALGARGLVATVIKRGYRLDV